MGLTGIFSSFEWLVSSRYLRSRRKQSFISIISLISVGGVAIGVATVILVISVMNGFEQSLKDKFLVNQAHVNVRSPKGYFSNYQEHIDRIEGIEGVVAASPAIYSQLAIQPKRSKRIEGTIYIKGIDPILEDNVTGFSGFVDGSFDFYGSALLEEVRRRSSQRETVKGGIVLGSSVASRLDINKGDVLRLISKMEPNPANPSTFFADVSNFVVIGLYESGMFAYDNAFGFISLEMAQDLYNQENHINLVQVRTNSPEIASTVASKIRREIQFTNTGLYSVPRTSTWVESHAALFEAIQLEKLVTVIIEALIILVASFNIASTLIMMVMEKTREIGILRSIGSSKMKILIIFILQGCIIGFLGIVLGSVLGVGVCLLLALEVVRPSRWFALLILVPIFLQIAITLHRTIRRSISLKLAVSSFWLGIIAFVLYCLVQPIQINSEVYQLNRLAVKIDWFFVGIINFFSFFICLLATLYPAWQASKLNPVEALRYE